MSPVPISALYSLAAAAFWGMGDFSGGMSVKSAPPGANSLGAALRVVVLSHLSSFAVLISLALALHQSLPGQVSFLWGILAGVLAGSSLAAFYIALSRGAMGSSAAISGLLAAAIPSALEILLEGSPGPRRLLGFLIAAIAIWLIAAGPAQPDPSQPDPAPAAPPRPESRTTMLLAVSAGIGFGLYFAVLKYAGAHSPPLWTLASARIGSILTCALMLLVYQLSGKNSGAKGVPLRMILWILSTALFDTSGNLLFILATRAGRLDIASVLASLYPAGTILLAAATLGERPTRRQVCGMGIAAAAVILITI